MDNSAKKCRFLRRKKKLSPSFLVKTSELNSCSNYEYFSDFFFTLADRKEKLEGYC